MKAFKTKFLGKCAICEQCNRVLVKKVYEEFSYKPLCDNCRTPHAAKVARQEFNSAGRGWVEIVPAVVA